MEKRHSVLFISDKTGVVEKKNVKDKFFKLVCRFWNCLFNWIKDDKKRYRLKRYRKNTYDLLWRTRSPMTSGDLRRPVVQLNSNQRNKNQDRIWCKSQSEWKKNQCSSSCSQEEKNNHIFAFWSI
jgi:hypothetical protein